MSSCANSSNCRRSRLFAALGLVVLLCCSSNLGAAGQNRPLTHITFGLDLPKMDAGYSSISVAQALGFFKEEGLDVTIQPVGGSAGAVQAVIPGRIDIGSAIPEPIATAIVKGEDLVMTYNFVRMPTSGIGVLADGPIRSLSDLKGKTLGVSNLATGEIAFESAALSHAGLDPKKDVQFLAVGVGAQALAALMARRVDGLALWDTQFASMENSGAKLRVLTSDYAKKLLDVQLFTKRSRINANPEFMIGFGRALAKATLFTSINPEAAIRLMYKQDPDTRIPGTSEEKQLSEDLVALKFRLPKLIAGDPAGTHSWGRYDPAGIQEWIAFASKGGQLASTAVPDKLYTNMFVRAYNYFDAAKIVEAARSWHQ